VAYPRLAGLWELAGGLVRDRIIAVDRPIAGCFYPVCEREAMGGRAQGDASAALGGCVSRV
jgi:hypothetical protein